MRHPTSDLSTAGPSGSSIRGGAGRALAVLVVRLLVMAGMVLLCYVLSAMLSSAARADSPVGAGLDDAPGPGRLLDRTPVPALVDRTVSLPFSMPEPRSGQDRPAAEPGAGGEGRGVGAGNRVAPAGGGGERHGVGAGNRGAPAGERDAAAAADDPSAPTSAGAAERPDRSAGGADAADPAGHRVEEPAAAPRPDRPPPRKHSPAGLLRLVGPSSPASPHLAAVVRPTGRPVVPVTRISAAVDRVDDRLTGELRGTVPGPALAGPDQSRAQDGPMAAGAIAAVPAVVANVPEPWSSGVIRSWLPVGPAPPLPADPAWLLSDLPPPDLLLPDLLLPDLLRSPLERLLSTVPPALSLMEPAWHAVDAAVTMVAALCHREEISPTGGLGGWPSILAAGVRIHTAVPSDSGPSWEARPPVSSMGPVERVTGSIGSAGSDSPFHSVRLPTDRRCPDSDAHTDHQHQWSWAGPLPSGQPAGPAVAGSVTRLLPPDRITSVTVPPG